MDEVEGEEEGSEGEGEGADFRHKSLEKELVDSFRRRTSKMNFQEFTHCSDPPKVCRTRDDGVQLGDWPLWISQ